MLLGRFKGIKIKKINHFAVPPQASKLGSFDVGSSLCLASCAELRNQLPGYSPMPAAELHSPDILWEAIPGKTQSHQMLSLYNAAIKVS